MAKAVQPALATDEITLELERFELVDGHLVLIGRWFGVRGRRFVRPTLTPIGGRDLPRVLADLEHKPWAAEDGEPWEAAFPWERRGSGTKFELSVAPDIVIKLPSPGAKLALPRRFAALPRQPSIAFPWRQAQPEGPSPPPLADTEPSQVEGPADQLDAITAELEAARAELAAAAAARDTAAGEEAAAIAARDQLNAENERLKAERDELEAALAELGTAHGNLTGVQTELEAGYAELQAAHADLQTAHTDLEAAFDELARERDQLSADLAASERAAGEVRAELDRSALAMQEAARERDEAITAHGAAMVMRRATLAAPHAGHSHSSWRAALGILALLGVIFAILIVAHVL